MSGYEIVNGPTFALAAGATASGGETCPAGKKVLSGGVDSSNAIDTVITRSYAISASLRNIAVQNTGTSPVNISFQVICAFA